MKQLIFEKPVDVHQQLSRSSSFLRLFHRPRPSQMTSDDFPLTDSPPVPRYIGPTKSILKLRRSEPFAQNRDTVRDRSVFFRRSRYGTGPFGFLLKIQTQYGTVQFSSGDRNVTIQLSFGIRDTLIFSSWISVHRSQSIDCNTSVNVRY